MSHRDLRSYHEPGETPREEMWQEIAARIRAGAADRGALEADIASGSERIPEVDFESGAGITVRPISRLGPWLGWAAAASIVLLVGIAVGRSTAPEVPQASLPGAPPPAAAGEPRGGLDVVVRGHLGRTESLLAAVRSDGRQGRLDPAAAGWARGLLTETRLLLDTRAGGDPTMVALLQELELVLAEIVLVAESGAVDESRSREELGLVLRTLELGTLLPRLQAACSRECVAPRV